MKYIFLLLNCFFISAQCFTTYTSGASELPIYIGASTSNHSIGVLPAYTSYELIHTMPGWLLIDYKGLRGFVRCDSYNPDLQPFSTPVAKPAPTPAEPAMTAWSYNTGDTPHCYNFRPEYNYNIDNHLKITMGDYSDVVIKLMKISYPTDICIRYIYVRSGTSFTARNIPEGSYYLKMAYGSEWMQGFKDGACFGRFNKSAIYEKGTDILTFNKYYKSGAYYYPYYELFLDVSGDISDTSNLNSDIINEQTFNK